jgi:hypothetical protein
MASKAVVNSSQVAAGAGTAASTSSAATYCTVLTIGSINSSVAAHAVLLRRAALKICKTRSCEMAETAPGKHLFGDCRSVGLSSSKATDALPPMPDTPAYTTR